jgi:hypothetical protein
MQDLSVEEAGFVDAGEVLAVDVDGDSGWHGNSTGRGDRCCLRTSGVARATVNHSQYWGATAKQCYSGMAVVDIETLEGFTFAMGESQF